MSDINVGAISEALNDKMDRDLQNVDTVGGADAVVEYQKPTAENNYTWYRKYASGWVEQGGIKEPTNATSVVISLPITMANKNYTCLIEPSGNDNDTGGWGDLQAVLCGAASTYQYGKAETGFRISCTSTVGINWEVKGMAA